MNRLYFLIFSFFLIIPACAQEYLSEGRNRLNFAKTYFEAGGLLSPGFTSKVSDGNSVKEITNPASVMPFLNIGGIHFWGHADFYISIPLGQVNLRKDHPFDLSQSVVTGARILPWAYRNKRLIPYAGMSWAVVNFRQRSAPGKDQPLFQQNKLLPEAGVLYGGDNWLIRAGAGFNLSRKWQYPLSPDNFQEISTPGWNSYLSFAYALETTRSKDMEQENRRLNRYGDLTRPEQDAIKTGDFFAGIGMATSFMTASPRYNRVRRPYFNRKPISVTYMDLSAGYHFNKAGIITALSYRNPKFTDEAFGITQVVQKNSVALEAYKFLTDYNGFTPYLGLNIAYDHLKFSEKDGAGEIRKKFGQFNPGITFGWDILPGKTEQFFVLRTNLRWYPFSRFTVEGQSYSQSQVEYNVIQAVFYPSRYRNARNKRNHY